MSEVKTVSVLGTEYGISSASQNDDSNLNGANGYTDVTSHKIVINKNAYADCECQQDGLKKTLRHELVHAFLAESGLMMCCDFASEECVDWIARQFPKMMKAFNDVGAL